MTPEQLFNYVSSYASKKEASGEGTQYPTFAQIRNRFSCTNDDIEDACNMYSGTGYMQPGVGVCNNSGYYEEKYRSNWVVEAYEAT